MTIGLQSAYEPDRVLVNERLIMPQFKMNIPKHDWDAAWMVFLAGATLEEVSEATGIPYKEVIQKASKKAWNANRAAAKRLATKDITEKLATRVQRARIKHANFVLDTLDEVEEKLTEVKVGDKDPEDSEGKRIVTMEKKLGILSQHDAIARKTLGLDKEEDDSRDPVKAGFMMLVGMQKAMQQNRNALVNEKVAKVKELPENFTPPQPLNGKEPE